jgi:hypothetical protein
MVGSHLVCPLSRCRKKGHTNGSGPSTGAFDPLSTALACSARLDEESEDYGRALHRTTPGGRDRVGRAPSWCLDPQPADQYGPSRQSGGQAGPQTSFATARPRHLRPRRVGADLAPVRLGCSTTRRELGTTDRRLRRRVSRAGRSAPANPARRRLDEWACFTAVDDCGPTAARGTTVPLPRVATADCG